MADAVATILFAFSTLPIAVKAYRTKDSKSYNPGYLLLGNAGNIFYSIYVFSLPPGPIWVLHTFYVIVTGLMLFWYLRYQWLPKMQFRLRVSKISPRFKSGLKETLPIKIPRLFTP